MSTYQSKTGKTIQIYVDGCFTLPVNNYVMKESHFDRFIKFVYIFDKIIFRIANYAYTTGDIRKTRDNCNLLTKC